MANCQSEIAQCNSCIILKDDPILVIAEAKLRNDKESGLVSRPLRRSPIGQQQRRDV